MLHGAAKNFPCLSFIVVVVVLHNFLMKYFEVIDGHCRETPFYVWSHTFSFLTMLTSTTLSKSIPCLLLFAVVLLRVRAARARESRLLYLTNQVHPRSLKHFSTSPLRCASFLFVATRWLSYFFNTHRVERFIRAATTASQNSAYRQSQEKKFIFFEVWARDC